MYTSEGAKPNSRVCNDSIFGCDYACKFHPTFDWDETQICIHAETCHICRSLPPSPPPPSML